MRKVFAPVIILGLFVASAVCGEQQLFIGDQGAEWIGSKIFLNECGGNDKYIITWNDGEDFISLGMGHFIWYPENKIGPFDESFPRLLKFIRGRGRELPEWVQSLSEPRCPWNSKEEFLRDAESQKVQDLRRFLAETRELQLTFIVNRLKSSLPKILKAAPRNLRAHVKQQFDLMAATPFGIYALVDYVNFSGEGTLATERYKGQGWGLLQVLERTKGYDSIQVIYSFVEAAKSVLAERVSNSPPERNEQKWLCGWGKRLDTYTEAMKGCPTSQ